MKIERLESRKLLSFTFENGVLTVFGTPGNDVITFEEVGGTILLQVNDEKPRHFPYVRVNEVRVLSGNGDDQILVDPVLKQALWIDAGEDDDIVEGGAGDDILVGGAGEDDMNGRGGNDILDGGDDNDNLTGEDGRDLIAGGFGQDNMFGGAGNDVFVNGDGETDFIDGGDDLDLVQEDGDNTNDVESNFDVHEDNESPTGGEGPDIILRTTPQLIITDVPLAATLNGSQLVVTGATSGGSPIADTVQITRSGDTIFVVQNGVTEEFAAASVTSISVDVGGGNDLVFLELNDGGNSVTVPATIIGGSGNDTLRGGSANDNVSGGTGNDSLLGAGGNDSLVGGDGDDILNGGSLALGTSDGRDTLQGGAGAGDYADYSTRTVALTLRLDGVANDGAAGENDFIASDIENALGGTKNDLIVGNSGVNLISGGAGADTLKGGGGNDQLIASYNNDSLIDSVFGNAGIDYLFLQDTKRDDHSVTTGDFLSKDNANDVVVPDQI